MNSQRESVIKRVVEQFPAGEEREFIRQLFNLAFERLESLTQLEDEIYQCYITYSSNPEDSASLDLIVTALRNKIFSPFNQLFEFLRSHGWMYEEEEGEEIDWEEIDFGAAFEELTSNPTGGLGSLGGISKSFSSLPQIDEFEIDQAFDEISQDTAGDTLSVQKLENLKREISILARALQNQSEEYERRLRRGFDEANYSLVIRELDASRTALLEGLFALISTIFLTVDEEFDPTVLPGYKNVLEHSLRARRGVTNLWKQVDRLNLQIQEEYSAGNREKVRELVGEMKFLLEEFISSPTFYYLQPPDRWELVNFIQQFHTENLGKLVQTAEGLSKYLESLRSLNQSEILLRFDQQKVSEALDLILAAESVAEFSIQNASELFFEAVETLKELYGRDLLLDQKIEELSRGEKVFTSTEEIKKAIDELREILKPLSVGTL